MVFLYLIIIFLVIIVIFKITKVRPKRRRRHLRRYISEEEKGENGENLVKFILKYYGSKDVAHREINNLIIKDEEGNTHQIDHIEIRENGIFCIETKNYSGLIFGRPNQRYWTQCLNKYKYKIINPLNQNCGHIKVLNKILNYKYKINSLVVMVKNNADKISVSNVINVKDLRYYLRDYDDGKTSLNKKEIEYIYKILINADAGISNKEHIKNLRNRGINSDN